jgi:polyhydroxyalkanoate synthase
VPTSAENEDNDDSAAGAASPMDTMLADAGSSFRRWLPGRGGLSFAAALARSPRPVARVARDAASELARVAIGRSSVEPDRKDRRFADDAWVHNPVLHRVMQAYLVASKTAGDVVEEIELDWRSEQRIRFLMDNAIEALAPSNNPIVNPSAWKAVIDTGGGSVARGSVAMMRDLATKPRIPRMVEPDAFRVGRDLAVTPGRVVYRSPVLELIEYAAQTDTVHETPLLVVPPMINKFYVVDLAPGRSLVEHLVGSGQHVFMISWRNPDRDAADWGLDRYAAAVIDALDTVESISGSPRTALLAVCAGGILSSMLMAHLAETGQQERIAALSMLVTVLDQHNAGTLDAMSDRRTTDAAIARSAKQGYLDGAALAEVFAWLRPRDLVWNYWVNNYLLGKPPPAFDILSWNADTTRMPARLYRDFIDIAQDNKLTEPGAVTLCGSPVDLSAVRVDSYIVAGVADHLCPWQNCYQSTQLLGGQSRFVLSTSGHIAAIVNPPDNAKASFHTSDDTPDDAEKWRESADKTDGSWWDDYTRWLAAHSGADRAAPESPGSATHPPLGDAPGSYVLVR